MSGDIYAALAAIQGEVGVVGKTRQNPQQGYKFRGIDDVMAHVQDLQAKHGVICVPRVVHAERELLETKREAALPLKARALKKSLDALSALDIGLEPVTASPVKPPVFLASGNPARILGDCKKVALKANWSLAQWVEFSSTARACLSPLALPEEWACFLRVVEERFAVTRGPRLWAAFDARLADWWAARERERLERTERIETAASAFVARVAGVKSSTNNKPGDEK